MAVISFVQTRGTSARFTFNQRTGSIVVVTASEGISVRAVGDDDAWHSLAEGVPVQAPLPYEGVMSVISDTPGEYAAVVHNLDADGTVLAELRIELVVLHVRVDVDADRDGLVGQNEEGKRSWAWGELGRGAIALVHNNLDPEEFTVEHAERSGLAEVIVRPAAAPIPDDCEFVLVTSDDEAKRISLYRAGVGGALELILGADPQRPVRRPRTTSAPLPATGARCFLEAHEYPGPFFEGVIVLELQLRRRGHTIGSDRAKLRVAPWIMTPNTLPAEMVYTCDTGPAGPSNAEFIAELRDVCDLAEVPLRVLPPDVHGGDRWIQDEIEFGFSATPLRTLPVVCDSPRDRELRNWASTKLGPDLGHFQIGGSTPNSLDAFGNLECSPPVTVRGRHYPYGRIIFGGRSYGDYGEASRQMMPELRRFFHAQKVQAPIELYTDWLLVGHVDEIVSFVPADTAKGFQILLAAPRKAEGIIDRLMAQGHADAVLFAGLRRDDPDSGPSAELTVGELRGRSVLWKANANYQASMDLNREILMMELDIDEADIIEVPVLFWPSGPGGRTTPFFPDMVNQLVLGDISVVPDPHGPVVDGADAFAEAFTAAMPRRRVFFVDTWYAYHQLLGEVHCGTNVRRRPPEDQFWWAHRPEGAFDI